MKKLITITLLTLCSLCYIDVSAQLNESFTDADFTSNPTWTGSSNTDWLVNPALQLQSNNQVANSTFYLSTPNTLATQTQWEFWVKIDFNPSSLNIVDAYLTASGSNLSATTTTGYFVRIGDTQDEISLYRKDASGATVKIIDGVDAILNNSTNTMKIKVIRAAGNQWTLFRDLTGTGSGYVAEGIVTDATYTTSSFFGFFVKQSTASFFQKHFFDDIQVQAYVPDVTPPAIQSVTATSFNNVDVLFNEPVDVTSSQTVSNYSVNNSVGNPSTAVRDASNSSLVHLTFTNSFANGTTNTITINGVKDITGNAISNGTATFSFFVQPPIIQSVTAISANAADVLFSKGVDLASSQTVTNYTVNNAVGNPASAVRDATNTSLVHLTFANNFPNGVTNTITINGVKDLFGVAITNGTGTFSFYTPQRYDVVIDEILADPTPQVALPNAEYVELKNTSGKSLNLAGWKIASTSTTSGALPSYILPADSFLVLTSTGNAASFSSYGRVLGVTSFPALDNTGTTLSLISKEGITIHSVTYNVAWYNNAVKSDGGWSLEMIDTHNPCSGAENWKASNDPRGGTPAAKNSVDGVNADKTAPALVRAAAIDSVTVIVTFSEPLDSLKGATAANYSISDGIGVPVSAITVSPSFMKVQLTLSKPLSRGKVYTLTANNVSDCGGNVIQAVKTTRLGLASVIDSFGIVINEILFNPKPNAVDYVEIYNRSQNVFDLKDLYIANRSTTGAIASLRQITLENILLFPGDYYVISENGALVKQGYLAKNPDNFIDVTVPSFNDDKGDVILLNSQGRIIDELVYDQKWHFSLIDNEEGVSLERVDYNKPTQDKNNFHSAASTVGFGTPSYQNSQFRSDVLLPGEITVTPKVFSPDNDGFDDFAIINFQMQDPGNVANITIYDAAGRPIKNLAKNATLAQTGLFRWDGLDDKLRKVPVGNYIIYTEVFNLSGKKRSFKTTVVVAARF